MDSAYIVPVVGITAGCGVAIAAIAFGCIRAAMQTRAREDSRREIAAYVAEGSISPDEAEKLLNAELTDKA